MAYSRHGNGNGLTVSNGGWFRLLLADHSVSQPIPMQRRPGSFPGNEAGGGGLLSPKSAENLGLKLVNYILEDNSPSVKELENRLKNVKLNYVSVCGCVRRRWLAVIGFVGWYG